MIGCSPCGDPWVIDTNSTGDLEIGFVSHDMLWGNDSPVREAYRAWPDPLLVFLDRLWEDPGYATF